MSSDKRGGGPPRRPAGGSGARGGARSGARPTGARPAGGARPTGGRPPASGAPRPSAAYRRDGGPGAPPSGPRGASGPRGPRREGGPAGGPPRDYSGARGPRREGGPGAGGPPSRGPRREGGPTGGGRDFGGPPPRRDFGGGGAPSRGPARGPRTSGPRPAGPPRDSRGPRDRDDRDFRPSRPVTPRRDDRDDAPRPTPTRVGSGRPAQTAPRPGAPRTGKRPGNEPFKGGAPGNHKDGIRLQALIARAGISSRRDAEAIILEGRVTLNGEVVTELGTRAVPGRDHIKVDGKLLREEERKVYFLLNKPRGVITAVTDPHGRPVVVDYLKVRERIFPVGRLDWDTEGVLLLTNDGDFSYRLTHPKFEITRTYHAKVRGIPDEKTLNRMRRGVFLEDGKAKVAKVSMLESTENNSWIEIVVQEGRNRLVRRLCEAVGHPVNKLKRVNFAGIELGNLKPGQSRALTETEINKLAKKLHDAKPQPIPRGRFATPPAGFKPGAKPSRVHAESSDEEE